MAGGVKIKIGERHLTKVLTVDVPIFDEKTKLNIGTDTIVQRVPVVEDIHYELPDGIEIDGKHHIENYNMDDKAERPCKVHKFVISKVVDPHLLAQEISKETGVNFLADNNNEVHGYMNTITDNKTYTIIELHQYQFDSDNWDNPNIKFKKHAAGIKEDHIKQIVEKHGKDNNNKGKGKAS